MIEVHRASLLHFRADPGDGAASLESGSASGSASGAVSASAFEYFEDGALVIDQGRIVAIGPASHLMPSLPADARVIAHGRRLLLPGFIDTHIHYPQTDVIGSAGHTLLDWLNHHTYPAEQAFADAAHAREVAEFFLDELLRNGTTTAMVFATVHRASVEAFFEAAAARRLRMIAGKVLMDRNAPEALCDTPESAERDSRELLEKWSGRARLGYAITPRFAPASSSEELRRAGELARAFPQAHIQSHLAESREEVAWARRLFPEARSYLDVYDRFGLVRARAVYAHCIHLDSVDRHRMAQAGAAAAFCPSSNLFLGSGLFDIAAADDAGLRFAVATDVGAGTSFSLLRTLGDAYKVAQLSGRRLSPLRAFYLATLGAARILGIDAQVGHLNPGAEADFIALDLEATPLIARRIRSTPSLAEKLAVLMTLGDDRCIAETYVLGRRVYAASGAPRVEAIDSSTP